MHVLVCTSREKTDLGVSDVLAIHRARVGQETD